MRKRKRFAGHRGKPAWIILIGFILFLAYLYIGGDYGLLEHYRQHKKREALLNEIDYLKAEQDSLRLVIKKLKSDSSFMAKVAREKYNMGYSDEEIIRVIRKEDQ